MSDGKGPTADGGRQERRRLSPIVYRPSSIIPSSPVTSPAYPFAARAFFADFFAAPCFDAARVGAGRSSW